MTTPIKTEAVKFIQAAAMDLLDILGTASACIPLDEGSDSLILVGLPEQIAKLLPAAANKAAEEGELPALPDALEIDWPEMHSQALGCGVEDRSIHDRYEAAEYGWQDGVDKAIERVPSEIYDADQMREYALLAIAADRASRHVANKAEVEPVAYLVWRTVQRFDGDIEDWIEVGKKEDICDDGSPAFPVYATPPATTGASTAQSIDPNKWAHVAYAEDGKLQWMTGRKFDACELYAPVSGSVGASTVLTDERSQFEAWLQSRFPNAYRPIDEKTASGYYVFSENNILWEVWQARSKLAAQAGQVAVPEGFDQSEMEDSQLKAINCMDSWASAEGLPLYSDIYGIANGYNDVIRKICFEFSAGGYNSEGLMRPKVADQKLRWIIEDAQIAAAYRAAPSPAKESK